MDGRAFKVIKENKKAEAKKVLLWMLLMVFALLIVVLIVYVSYNRYMPSFLGWFKEEEDVVVEPVKEEIRIEQNVIDEFVELEKTISSALSEERAVKIMLNIKEIESKLKGDNSKQYNLAFEGQKIKLIDKSIEGSIPDQTVMEFAITTDEGIWIKADFESLDKHKEYECIQLKNYEINEKFICWNELEGKRIEIAPLSNSECNDPVKIIPIEMNNCKKQEDEYQQINFKFYQEIKEFLENPELCYYELNFKQIKSTSPIGIFYDNSGKEFLIKDVYGQGIRDRKKFENLEIGGDTQFDSENGNWIILSSDTHRDNIITIEKKDGRAVLNVYSPGNVRYGSLNSKIDYASAEFSCDGYNKAMKDIETFNECLKEFEKEGNEIVACNGFQNQLKFNHDTNIIEFDYIKDTNGVYPFKWDIDKIFKIEESETEEEYNVAGSKLTEYRTEKYLKLLEPNACLIYLSKRTYDSEQKCWKVLDANYIKIYPTINKGEDFKQLEIEFTEKQGSYLIINPNKLCEYKEPLVNFLQFIRNPDKNDFIFKNRQIVILKEYWDLFGNEYKQIYEDNYLTKYIDFKLKIDNNKVLSTSYDSKTEVVGNNFQQISLVYNLNGECIEMPIPEFEFDSDKIKQIYKINCPYDTQICSNSLDFSEFKLKKIKQGEDYKLVITFKDSWGCLEEYDSEPYIDAFNYLQVVYTFNSFIFYDKYHIKYDYSSKQITDNYGKDVENYKIEVGVDSFPRVFKWNSQAFHYMPLIRSNYNPTKIIVNLENENIDIKNDDKIIIIINRGESPLNPPVIVLKNVYKSGSYYSYYPKQLYFYTCGDYQKNAKLIMTDDENKLNSLRCSYCAS